MEYYAFTLGEPNPGSNDAESMEELLDEIKCADQEGFTGCFFAEHHNDRLHSLTSRPNLVIAAVAAQTKHLRLGTMVTILGLHHPFVVAEEIATLDVLSNGRVEYGVGSGGFGFRQLGISIASAKDRLEEGVQLMERFFDKVDQEEIPYQGRFWSGTIAPIVPPPVQKPHPPLWITGHSDESIRTAAKLKASFCTGFVSCATVSERRRMYREEWETMHPGQEPARVAHMILVAVGDSRREVEMRAIPAMRTKLHQFAKATRGRLRDPSYSFEQALRDRYGVNSWRQLVDEGIIVYGSIQDCIEQLEKIRDTAGDALLMQPRFEDIDRSFSRESFLRLASEVLPKVGGRRGELIAS